MDSRCLDWGESCKIFQTYFGTYIQLKLKCAVLRTIPPLYVLSCLWDGAYKRTLAANQKEYPMWRQQVSSLAI